MQLTLTIFTALLSIVKVSALPTAGQNLEVRMLPFKFTLVLIVRKQARDLNITACGDPKTAVPWLRAYNAKAIDHFYTTNVTEMQNAITNLGYSAEGITGLLFSDQEPSTVPLYRLYSDAGTDHFYTTAAKERDNAIANLGYVSEGITGYIYPDTNCSGLPLYRSYNAQGIDHFYTMSAAESDNAVAAGWAKEGITGYMIPVAFF
jgi:Repeat of unknown function (DUF5648)